VSTGGSFGAGPLEMHVGLGTASRIAQVRVHWPDRSRTTTTYDTLTPDAHYRIVQGAPPARLTRPAVPFRTVAAPGGHDMMKMPGM
jgi:hypothetical protein